MKDISTAEWAQIPPAPLFHEPSALSSLNRLVAAGSTTWSWNANGNFLEGEKQFDFQRTSYCTGTDSAFQWIY